MSEGPGILVVDDNQEVREVLCELLQLEGYKVSTADSGLGALLRIGHAHPACVVLDLKLEDVSGFEIYRILRADPDFCDLPVLFISGAYPDGEQVERRLGTGPIHFLAKPIVQRDLLEAVRKLVA